VTTVQQLHIFIAEQMPDIKPGILPREIEFTCDRDCELVLSA